MDPATDQPSTTTAPTDKKQKAAPVKVHLDADSERTVATLKEKVNVPGTRIGYLARGIETVLRDTQERLDRDGKAIQVLGALDHKVDVPIKAQVRLEFAIQVGDGGAPTSFVFVLTPGPHAAPTQPTPPAA